MGLIKESNKQERRLPTKERTQVISAHHGLHTIFQGAVEKIIHIQLILV